MARPTPRPQVKKELDIRLENVHRARVALAAARKNGGNMERAEAALKRAWFAVRSHCDRHGLPMPADDADFEEMAAATIEDSKDILKELE